MTAMTTKQETARFTEELGATKPGKDQGRDDGPGSGRAATGEPAAIDLQRLADELGRPRRDVEAAVALLDAGNTVPFIARYRKEQTGGMDDAELRALADAVAKARALEERRADVLRLLAEHGHLTPELEQEVRAAATQQRLEDLYRPFRPKRRTRASVAKERGLEPPYFRVVEESTCEKAWNKSGIFS